MAESYFIILSTLLFFTRSRNPLVWYLSFNYFTFYRKTFFCGHHIEDKATLTFFLKNYICHLYNKYIIIHVVLTLHCLKYTFLPLFEMLHVVLAAILMPCNSNTLGCYFYSEINIPTKEGKYSSLKLKHLIFNSV